MDEWQTHGIWVRGLVLREGNLSHILAGKKTNQQNITSFNRVWLILGILYYYRALTMFITVLPKPDETYICAPKVFIFSFTKGFWLFWIEKLLDEKLSNHFVFPSDGLNFHNGRDQESRPAAQRRSTYKWFGLSCQPCSHKSWHFFLFLQMTLQAGWASTGSMYTAATTYSQGTPWPSQCG